LLPAIVKELLGEIATTSAASVATAAVDAGLTAAAVVPSVIFVGHAEAKAAAVPWLAVTVPETGTAPWSDAMTTGRLLALVLLPTVGAVEPSQDPRFSSRRPPTSAAGNFALMALNVASVAAPVGKGREAAETGRVLWSEASTTGVLAAIVFCPRVLILAVKVASARRVASVASEALVAKVTSVARVDRATSRLSVFALIRASVASVALVAKVASVAAPVGRGNVAAEIGCVTADPSTLRALPAVTAATLPPLAMATMPVESFASVTRSAAACVPPPITFKGAGTEAMSTSPMLLAPAGREPTVVTGRGFAASTSPASTP
jgi:hypothetical protein